MAEINTVWLKSTVSAANHIVVVLPENSTLDQVASGLGLYLSMKLANKQVQLWSPTPMTAEFNRLVGVDQVAEQLSGQKLVISLPNQHQLVDRVYTEIDQQTGNFDIVIEPRKGAPAPNHQTVNYRYQNVQVDLMVFIGTRLPEDLNQATKQLKPYLQTTQIIRIDLQSHNHPGYQFQIVDEQVTSISEIIFQVLTGINYPIDADIATNILAGIEHQTQNFALPQTKPITFEIVAACLRAGAVRGYAKTPTATANVPANIQVEMPTQDALSSVIPAEPATADLEIKTEELRPTNHEQSEVKPKQANRSKVPGWMIPKIFQPGQAVN